VRGGKTAEGRGIWNPLDTTGDKIQKALIHLGASQAPLNWKQFERLKLAITPKDSEGRFDKYGNEFDLGNELLGMVGLRNVKVQPEKGIDYKITDYKRGIRDARSLFTTATTKGGPITPEEILDAYINSNRALYQVNREMYKDIEAAKILGMNRSNIEEIMIGRGERNAYRAFEESRFRPLEISKPVRDLFELNARELGITNPFDVAYNQIERLQNILSRVSLDGDFFPELENPFSNLPEPTLGPAGNIPTNVLNTTPNIIGAQNISIPYNQLTTQEQKLQRIDTVNKAVR